MEEDLRHRDPMQPAPNGPLEETTEKNLVSDSAAQTQNDDANSQTKSSDVDSEGQETDEQTSPALRERRKRTDSSTRSQKAWKVKGAEAKTNSHQATQPPTQAQSTPSQQTQEQMTAQSSVVPTEPQFEGRRLNDPWTFWYSKKEKRKKEYGKRSKKQQEEKGGILEIGTCRTVEEFWHIYCYLKRPNTLPKESNYHFFRNRLVPMWETFPRGGCFIIRVPKNERLVETWEELLFAMIGEAFDEPNVVGVVVSIRSKEDAVSIWMRSNQKTLRMKVSEKLKEILKLEKNAVIEYKDNSNAMRDRSTYKNAKKFLIVSS